MKHRQKRPYWLTVILLISFVLVACERPIPDLDGSEEVPTVDVTDPNVGGGAAGDAETAVTPVPDSSVTESAPAAEATATSTEGPAAAEATPESEQPTAEATEETAAEETETATTESPDATAVPDDDGADGDETPQTHTVAAGENLYRIGLKYGISWVTLAQINSLADPNRLTVGQVLQLSAGDDDDDNDDPPPTQSPQTETTYTVKAGDNLYRIGLAFNISWIQIAEANGIVNPNLIIPGTVLKIPTNTPGPTPEFTHTVRQNETLFLISLRYGIAWTTIAEANEIESPYIIFPGQTLLIPMSAN